MFYKMHLGTLNIVFVPACFQNDLALSSADASRLFYKLTGIDVIKETTD